MFTHLHKPVELECKEEFEIYQKAIRHEQQIKCLSVARKDALITDYIALLKQLSKSRLYYIS